MKLATAEKVIKDISWEITKCERFLNLVARANKMSPKDRENILKGACWKDGTITTQIQYTIRKRERLVKARNEIANKYELAK